MKSSVSWHETIVDPSTVELSQLEFRKISELAYSLCGIKLPPGKELLVKSRLSKRLKVLGMSSFKEYISYLEKDKSGQEIVAMIDCLTTNKTSFFREAHHFDYLQEHVLPSLTAMKKKRIRIWSAGCSTGEEPYTIAIVLRESLDNLESLDVRILATDISTRVLHTAREGIYPAENLEDVPMELRYKYFTKVAETKEGSQYKINENIKALVKFARLNLLDPWPMKGPFDVIFCRNVMIYFDKETQQMLVNRFTDLLGPEGYLFVGHSESLMSINHRLTYVQPAIYKKLRN